NVPQGSGDTEIAVLGAGFVPQSTVQWDGAAIATSFVDSTRLTAVIPGADLLVPGTHLVAVTSPAPGGGTSSALSFVITPAAVNAVPSIVAVSPTSVPIATIDTQITIHGANFVPASTAQIGSQELATSY